ncbi:MAG: hypothetical protein NVS9B10_18060 [Nevskia sp.]
MVAEDSPIEVAAGQAAAPVAAQCADCAAPVSGKYCAACGQETRIETPTVKHFLQEFADQYVALEGKLGRTLRVLILKPGQLTLDYVEGRRQRYVRPLKLYLTISVVFFTLLGLLPDSLNPISRPVETKDEASVQIDYSDQDKNEDRKKDEANAAAASAGPEAAEAPKPGSTPAPKTGSSARTPEPEPAPGSFEAKVKDRAEAFSKLSREQQNRLVGKKLADDAPYAMFFLLPYFALLLKFFYRETRQRYGVHLLFSLHLHSFVFILLAFGFLPLPELLRSGLQIGAMTYVFFALRRVYGGTVVRTLWRMFWLFSLYVIALSISAASGILTALFGGSWA